MSLYDFVVPLGIASISIVFLAVVLGVFKKLLPAKVRFRLHRILGFIALGVAAVHGGIVFYFKFFV